MDLALSKFRVHSCNCKTVILTYVFSVFIQSFQENIGRITQGPGRYPKFQNNASNAGTMSKIPGECFTCRESTSNSIRKLLTIPGKCLKCRDSTSDSTREVPKMLWECLKSHNSVSKVGQYLKFHDSASNAGRVPQIPEECLKCRKSSLPKMQVKFFKLPDCTPRDRTVSQMPKQ
jgi:hypothetical protein